MIRLAAGGYIGMTLARSSSSSARCRSIQPANSSRRSALSAFAVRGKSGHDVSIRTSSSSLSLDCVMIMKRYQREYIGSCSAAHFAPMGTGSW